MTLPWSPLSIRVRLTTWYAAVLTMMLMAYAAATFVAVRHEFMEQLDERLHDDFEAGQARLERSADGRVLWTTPGHADAHPDEARVYEVWSTTGEQLHRSGVRRDLPLVAPAASGAYHTYESVVVDGERWRSLAAVVTIGRSTVVLRVARSEQRLREELSEIVVVLVLGLPFAIALAGVGGYVLARRALAPIDRLASEARRITAERLHERVTVPNQADEIGRLAAVMNGTFARLEASFDQLRRFTADSSHELRTPLAVVRGIGEAAVAQRRSPADYEEAIGSMLEEIDRMATLVDTLLRLSHGDAGAIRLSPEPLDLGELAREVGSSLLILAEERGQRLAFEIAGPPVVPVDRAVMREALTNVLDNAIKYSPVASTIAIRVRRAGERAEVCVADEGPGVPTEHRERIFHRFFRVDEARTRDRGGAGLGLAIAKWAVDIHDGEITVAERSGGGSEFRILMPLRGPGIPARADRTGTE